MAIILFKILIVIADVEKSLSPCVNEKMGNSSKDRYTSRYLTAWAAIINTSDWIVYKQ